MGCDIHAFLEIKIDDKWEHYAPLPLKRDYDFFGKLAGVRVKKYDPIAAGRGLPKGVSKTTDFHLIDMEGDDHSHSWISAQELYALKQWLKERESDYPWGDYRDGKDRKEYHDFGLWLFENSISGFIEYPEDRPKGLQDIRMVFWFDN